MSDPELPGLASYDYQRVFGLLGRHRTAVGEQRVVNLEWQFFPALGFDADAPALHEALADHPGFFAELVGYVYKRDPAPAEDDQATGDDAEQVGADVDDEPESPLDAEQRREFATRAYRLLRSWRRCPGAGPDNRPTQWSCKRGSNRLALASPATHVSDRATARSARRWPRPHRTRTVRRPPEPCAASSRLSEATGWTRASSSGC